MYHSVGSVASGDALGIYGIAPELFAKHMAALAAHADIAPVALAPDATSPRRTRVAVTFDDGYRDNLTLAAPVLLQHQIPFTVFVCTGFMRDASGNFLTATELRELAALPGVTIGSHGATHAPLTGLDDAALRNELASSKAEIEDATGRPVNAISYPHGAVDRRVRNAAAAAGYAVGACSRFDINDAARDRLLLCRTDIHGNDPVRVFEQKLRGDWDWYRWRSADPAMS
jgi:peptidoglycan/xylan/chitin deacetylase (PgdA/CDA1 family)